MNIRFIKVMDGMSWELFKSEKLDKARMCLIVINEYVSDNELSWDLYIGSKEDGRRAKYLESHISSPVIKDGGYYKPGEVSYRYASKKDREIYKAVVRDRGFA